MKLLLKLLKVLNLVIEVCLIYLRDSHQKLIRDETIGKKTFFVKTSHIDFSIEIYVSLAVQLRQVELTSSLIHQPLFTAMQCLCFSAYSS